MRVVFVLFDTLIREHLECYGGTIVPTPNFNRLAKRSATFDRHYVGSLPCMPARRDLHTGRLNFLHRSWGPLEPFDTSFAECLRKKGVYSHLITDHYHYFELGGLGYAQAFNSFEYVRGQEGDLWKADVAPPIDAWRDKFHPAQFSDKPGTLPYHYMMNREHIVDTGQFPSSRCFELASEFLRTNHKADNWFLQIETFDPHEPFYAPPAKRQQFPTDYDGPVRDWPPYDRVTEDEREADELRANYRALLSHCDDLLGRLLDQMDEFDMWHDTMLVVSTDHGFLLGEHGWWAKNRMPAYEEIAHIPLFVHHPDYPGLGGSRRDALTQTPDLMPTFLEAFDVDLPPSVRSKSLFPVLSSDEAKLHDAVIFGYFGGSINMTDGRYSYFRYPDDVKDQEIHQYTLLPLHMKDHFSLEEFQRAELHQGDAYFQGYPVLKIPVIPESPWYQSHGPAVITQSETLVFDVENDPRQLEPLRNDAVQAQLDALLCSQMKHHDAPAEVFRRFGLPSR